MIRVGVIGYGYAGRAFHSYLVGLAEGLQLRAIVTGNPERQAAAREAYPEALVYERVEDLLADAGIDLVVLATPHDTHRDLALQAFAAGKHVVTDKVMAMNAREAQEMIDASREAGKLLSVFHNRRWDWDYLTVQRAIDDGLLGEVYLVQAAIMRYGAPRGWRADKAASGGILYDWPAHFVDQALQLVDAPVRRVYCTVTYRDVWPTDIGNYGKLLITFENDVLYEIEIGNLAAVDKPRWYVLGTEGGLVKVGIDPQEEALRAGDILSAEEDPAQRARLVRVVGGERQERVLDSVRGSWTSYYQNISDALNLGAELAVKPEEVLRVMQVYDAAMRSAESGQAVEVHI